MAITRSARLMSEIGGNRAEYPDAQGLQCVAGTAPVSFESGQVHRAKIPWHCNRHLRYAVHLWADCSRKFCAWAQAYYQAQRGKGKSHACALRCLAHRWLEIIGGMTRTHTTYNAEHHLREIQKHGSYLLRLINTPAPKTL